MKTTVDGRSSMSIFGKNNKYPKFPEGGYEPVIRCSICTGEKVICARDKKTGELTPIQLIAAPDDLDGFCRENGLDASKLRKVY